MPLGHLMYISTSILGCKNSTPMSHSSAIHTYSTRYKIIPIRILVEVSNSTGNNDPVKSTPGTSVYPLTKFIEFRRLNPSGSSLLLNTYLTGTGFLSLDFKLILFVGIHALLDRKFSLQKWRKLSTNVHLVLSLIP